MLLAFRAFGLVVCEWTINQEVVGSTLNWDIVWYYVEYLPFRIKKIKNKIINWVLPCHSTCVCLIAGLILPCMLGACPTCWSNDSPASTLCFCSCSCIAFSNSVLILFHDLMLNFLDMVFMLYKISFQFAHKCIFFSSALTFWILISPCYSAWVNLLPEPENWGGSVACIGETTASAARKLGLRSVYYPSSPGLQGY